MGMQRTAAGLREILFEQIDKLREGRTTPTEAKAVAAVAHTILKSVEVEMSFREQQRQLGDAGQIVGDLELAALPAPAPSTGKRVVRGRDMADD